MDFLTLISDVPIRRLEIIKRCMLLTSSAYGKVAVCRMVKYTVSVLLCGVIVKKKRMLRLLNLDRSPDGDFIENGYDK